MAKNKSGTAVPDDYAEVFESLKQRVRQSQTKAMLSVNRELVQLYWDIGRQIAERQDRDGWGKSIVDHLAYDLRAAFSFGERLFARESVANAGILLGLSSRPAISRASCA